MSRASKIQAEYVKKHGAIGMVIPKSKVHKNRRYYLHKMLRKAGIEVDTRSRRIGMKVDDIPQEVYHYAAELIRGYGYYYQTTILDEN